MLLKTTALVLAGTLLAGVFRAELAGAKSTASTEPQQADVPSEASALAHAQNGPEDASDESKAGGAESENSSPSPAMETYCCCHPSSGMCTMSTDPCGSGTTRIPCPCPQGACLIIDP